MKVGKKGKKLILNKISVANLDNCKIYQVKDGLQRIKGGNVDSTACQTKDVRVCSP